MKVLRPFHPFATAFSGFSGAGKTTLLEHLAAVLSPPLRLGFVKSDAHRIQMDKPGKDTFRLSQAGCSTVAIRSAGCSALLHAGDLGLESLAAGLSDMDAVLLEGFRDTALPKLLMLDSSGEALRELNAGRFENVLALVHAGQAPDTHLPCFHRDDVRAIAAFVESDWRSRSAPLKGLVLAGGRSRRMGEDKANLRYHQRPQASHAFALLSQVCSEVFVSRAPDQACPEGIREERVLRDRLLDAGPLGGIVSAMMHDAHSAWLVAACDLPLLGASALAELVARRDPFKVATAFLDPSESWPEPLCTIWEPKAFRTCLDAIHDDRFCPRQILSNSPVHLLDCPGQSLFNANTPDQRREFLEVA